MWKLLSIGLIRWGQNAQEMKNKKIKSTTAKYLKFPPTKHGAESDR